MYSCLYNNCGDINLFLYVCRNGFLHTSGTSFRGIVMMHTTLLLPHLWIYGNLPRAFLILNTREMLLIIWAFSCHMDESWSHSARYMRWFYRVSHPIVNPHAVVPNYAADAHLRHVPPYEEVIAQQQWPDILLIRLRSSATWEADWSMQCRFLRWFQIHSFWAFWRASGPIIPYLTRCWLRGGVGVHRSRV